MNIEKSGSDHSREYMTGRGIDRMNWNWMIEDRKTITKAIEKGEISYAGGIFLQARLLELMEDPVAEKSFDRYHRGGRERVCITEAPMYDFLRGSEILALNRWLQSKKIRPINPAYWFVKDIRGLPQFLERRESLKILSEESLKMAEKRKGNALLQILPSDHRDVNAYVPIPEGLTQLSESEKRRNTAHLFLENIFELIKETFEERPHHPGSDKLKKYVKKRGLLDKIVGYRYEKTDMTVTVAASDVELQIDEPVKDNQHVPFNRLSEGIEGIGHLRLPYEEICEVLNDESLDGEVRLMAEQTKFDIMQKIRHIRDEQNERRIHEQHMRDMARINEIRHSIGLHMYEGEEMKR